NVKLSASWDFVFKNISIGSGADFSDVSGDGIKWSTDNNASSTPNKLTLNSSYTHNNNILSTIGVGSTVDFQTSGYIKIIDVSGNGAGISYLSGKALTLSASVTLTASTDTNAPLKKVTRYLIEGPNIWYRDVDASNTNKVVDYTLSSVSETSGLTLTKYDLATSEDAAWMLNGTAVGADDLSAGAYRFVATESDGIGIQYWDNNVPEPTTATLSLLALAGLAARRRRRIA
ncbi:MAG: PEP-CTERM sorting domain-containing protein, partial [Akkermansia sp.]